MSRNKLKRINRKLPPHDFHNPSPLTVRTQRLNQIFKIFNSSPKWWLRIWSCNNICSWKIFRVAQIGGSAERRAWRNWKRRGLAQRATVPAYQRRKDCIRPAWSSKNTPRKLEMRFSAGTKQYGANKAVLSSTDELVACSWLSEAAGGALFYWNYPQLNIVSALWWKAILKHEM